MLWHASRSEINHSLMFEDLKNEDLSYVMLRIITLKAWMPGSEFQVGMPSGNVLDLFVPQFPKLYNMRIIAIRISWFAGRNK